MKNPKEAIGDAWGIPKDISLDLPHITLSANREMYIENYKSLILYESEKIIVGSRKYELEIRGKNLQIKQIRRDDILIFGEILHIEYKI